MAVVDVDDELVRHRIVREQLEGDHIALLTNNNAKAFEVYWAALRSGLYITAVNRHLAPQMETVFMVPSLDTTYISSSLVREIARFQGDVDSLVHPAVASALRRKFPAA